MPDEQLVVTWEGCGSESGVNFRPVLSAEALRMLRAEVALLREKLARAELEKPPVDRRCNPNPNPTLNPNPNP